jgi:hypothetical protein
MRLARAAGPALRPGALINLVDPKTGRPARSNNAMSPAYLGAGLGAAPEEQFAALSPAALVAAPGGPPRPPAPAGRVLLRSSHTGRYCRLAAAPGWRVCMPGWSVVSSSAAFEHIIVAIRTSNPL